MTSGSRPVKSREGRGARGSLGERSVRPSKLLLFLLSEEVEVVLEVLRLLV